MKRVLLAGASGYLGKYILKELHSQGYFTRALVRSPGKLSSSHKLSSSVYKAEITKPETLHGCCEGIDIVISTIGITNQKDGLSYMDVDYQANANLLKEAMRSGVKKFMYVSVLNGEKLRHLKICEAKEKFVDELKASGLDYCIVRPNGFFSDMAEFFTMAQKGRVYFFGNGDLKANPIHGADLAEVCVDAINCTDEVIEAGGPEILTQEEIALKAFDALNKKPKITYIPHWIRKLILTTVRTFSNSKIYGPVEFFMTVLSMDMIAPVYGKHKIGDFFKELSKVNQ